MQPSIEDQLTIESRMIARGIEKYKAQQTAAEQNGRGAETGYARKLIQAHLEAIEDGIKEYLEQKGATRFGKVRNLIAGVQPGQAAYFLLRGVFQSFQMTTCPIQTVVAGIGKMVEDEIRFTKFQEAHRDYYDALIAEFKRKGTKSYTHMHRVLTYKANEREDGWVAWTQEERCMVGAKLLDIMMARTQLVRRELVRRGGRNKDIMVIRPTDEATEWVQKYSEHASMLDPDRMPCIVEPDPWTAVDQGGFYSPELRSLTKLVLNGSKRHEGILRKSDLSQVLTAINRIQATPWRVNARLFATMREVWDRNLRIGMPASEPYEIPTCPLPPDLKKDDMTPAQFDVFMQWKAEAAALHTAEGERVSKCFQLARAMRMAAEYSKYDRFWFVYQCDFRGRMYAASPGFNPQSSDTSKSLIEFAEGKALGKDGFFWLLVHGANCYGFDKATFEDRAAFVKNMHNEIVQAAADPMNHRDVWANADSPWQFLAFCFEYADAHSDPENFVSRIPVAMDGSCNGLQHFSAMLRDEVGGGATNLVPMHKPADIYTSVAQVCTQKLAHRGDKLGAVWLDFCREYGKGAIPRKLAKKPVMTLPYGSTQRACTDSIFQFVFETDRDWFKRKQVYGIGNNLEQALSAFSASVHLTPILWGSIGEVVIAARAAMDWIRDAAAKIAKQNIPLLWHTPTGWPVFQANYEIETRKIDTQICGRVQMKVGHFTNDLDLLRMKNGASPNFVHSMDASHMVMTVNRMPEGVSFAMIHDSYGAHACDIPALGAALRDAFIDLYENNDPLSDLRTELSEGTGVDLPEIPERGGLDLSQVRQSRYFFS